MKLWQIRWRLALLIMPAAFRVRLKNSTLQTFYGYVKIDSLDNPSSLEKRKSKMKEDLFDLVLGCASTRFYPNESTEVVTLNMLTENE